MDAILRRIQQLVRAATSAVPVIADLVGVVLIVSGVYRLETSQPGIWLIVAGLGAIAIGFVTQDV